MIVAVLTIFMLVSGVIIFLCLKEAVAVDEDYNPVTNPRTHNKPVAPQAKTGSIVFHHFSSSRHIA
ncbi:hypothetical protein I5907_09020 [Panacibacter sp. DH6]|uniref:Uncharacterized protein n=1 Tax=Panacibacter microcysteis TaxID=2793269 RepID=A0A931E0H8_9BACT|nr:hypothetical protein [Panacibacter microcysteis]MBG9376372.1 hypothetical protein [Panacibacter microcysteis]